MIEINLLPKELQKKKTGKKIALLPFDFIYLAGAFFSFVIIMQILLPLQGLMLSRQLNSLDAAWKSLEPQRKEVDAVKNVYSLLSQDAEKLRQLEKENISWSDKLGSLSAKLPGGVWFNEITLADKTFKLEATVISLQKQELALVNKFLGNLKEDANFFDDFSGLSLGEAQRSSIGGYEIIVFNLDGKLK